MTRAGCQDACIHTLKKKKKYFETSCEYPNEIDKNTKLTVENARIQMETMDFWQPLKIVFETLNKFMCGLT